MFDTLLALLSPARLLGRLTSQEPTPPTTRENEASPHSVSEGRPGDSPLPTGPAYRTGKQAGSESDSLGREPVLPARRRRRRRPRRPSERTAHAEDTAAPPEEGMDVRGAATFGDLPVSSAMGRTLQEIGYLEPTPVQCEVIPLMLAGGDLVGQAQTGTGKTAAFGIPLAETLDASLDVVQAIVLVPTRELALQVSKELERLTQYTGQRVVTLYGGQPIVKQFVRLEPPPQIIVGTPGRVLDHLGRGTLRLDTVRVAILDEADEMLDIGFAPDMERILRLTPKSRQTALFSATMPPFILRLIRRYLREPAWVQIQPEEPTVPEEIEQIYYEVAERDKLQALSALLAEWGALPRALVFCRMQVGVDRLTAALRRRGYKVSGIHGGMTQGERTRVMTGFREGAIQALIATNVAARGLDIPDITVVSYDAPQNAVEYIHRIGRTGRMGRKGTAITFFAEWDLEVLDQVKARMGDALREERSSIYSRAAV